MSQVNKSSDSQVVKYTSFAQFYPFYLSQHRHPTCRLLHFIGTQVALLVLLYLLYHGSYSMIWVALLPGYGSAWIGHFFFEQNKPATFKYPLYSFMGDWVMIYDLYTGKIPMDEKNWKPPKERGSNYEK